MKHTAKTSMNTVKSSMKHPDILTSMKNTARSSMERRRKSMIVKIEFTCKAFSQNGIHNLNIVHKMHTVNEIYIYKIE